MVVFPRGVGLTAWPADKDAHLRRRFELLGQTLGGMQVWDVRRALALLKTLPELRGAKIEAVASGPSSALALWAAVFEPEIQSLALTSPPRTIRDGPAFLNLERLLEMPQALGLLFPRRVLLINADSKVWLWASEMAKAIEPSAQPWPILVWDTIRREPTKTP